MIKLSGTIKELVSTLIAELMKLDMDKLYVVEIKEVKSKRSLEQNKMLWQLIHAIAKETHQDDMEVYCACLERADALSDYVITATLTEEELRKHFRGVRFVRTTEVKGNEFNVYKVYLGSSKMNTKEMTELLDITLQICGELGIPTWGWEYE